MKYSTLLVLALLPATQSFAGDDQGVATGVGSDKGTACASANQGASLQAGSGYGKKGSVRFGECQCGADKNGTWTCSVTWTRESKE
jgi:hypothetical protein